jgi:AcrR family transcriptional regulator
MYDRDMQRSYTSPLRAEQARQTRLAIITAAFRLFLANGYSRTSVRSIAHEAGVSERTVYVAFGDKISLISAIADHERFGGTEEGEGEAQFVESLRAVADPLERLRLAVHQMALGREHGLAMIARIVRAEAPSDPGMRRFLDGMVDYRHRGTMARAELILGRPLPEGPETEQLVDELEAIFNEETYLLLAVERGWSGERYEAYVVDMCLVAMRRAGIELW